MSIEEHGQLILGKTLSGHKFRPSDWVDRIATSFADFSGQRLKYHPLVRPAYNEGVRCLFVADALAEQEPAGYEFILSFASGCGLQITPTDPQHIYSTAA